MFLDEIGELPIETQAKLLRVLQERSLERVGGHESIAVDIRLIAATNRELGRDVAAGRFREDLYYRLAVFPVPLPPLRDRPGDIVPLAQSFVRRYASSFGMADAKLASDAESALLRHRWPGNVRELENTIQRGLLLTDTGVIEASHLELPDSGLAAPVLPTAVAAVEAAAPTPVSPELPPAMQQFTQAPRPRNVRDAEREHILSVVEQVQGDRRKAIAILGISERALRYKLKAYRELENAGNGELTNANPEAETFASQVNTSTTS